MNQPWAFAMIGIGQFIVAIKLALVASSIHQNIGWMAAIISAGLGFDNSVLAFGQSLLAKQKLLAISRVRYLLHSLVTPLLLPLAFYTAQLGGMQLSTNINILTWLVSGAWIVAAWNFGYCRLELEVVQDGTLVRHHNKSRSGQPWLRLMLVGVVVVILVLGSISPSVTTKTLMLIGGSGMLIGAIASRKMGLYAANLGELILMASLTFALLQ